MTEFPFATTVDVRYQDHDTLGHVNNAVYVTYMEEARVAYLREYAGLAMDDISMVVAHLDVDFRRTVEYADEVEVAVGVTDVGGSSFTMAYEVRDGETVAVEGESVQVTLDPETGESQPVPDEWRDSFEPVEG
ncbi:thioesterase domain protein [Halobacterium hubeiense]|jgi:acyl-CoA thioester hydrolase|uniref:Thioesterase domain protein n=1 Tax=Halobacterium hubeiense TaxID=1407499 RepID=A0A0U5H7N1_9EURY|nr:thioesterase family protein [Halobacterium hubeiense]CQH58412.1 thioesterase domain protein [Halobacterium hubeiense]